jgi:hypothetical protein
MGSGARWIHPSLEAIMTDPREPVQRRDPNERTPDVGGPDAQQKNEASDLNIAQEEDADELDADNPVEEDTLETLDPDNAPA